MTVISHINDRMLKYMYASVAYREGGGGGGGVLDPSPPPPPPPKNK